MVATGTTMPAAVPKPLAGERDVSVVVEIPANEAPIVGVAAL
jgi:hypothetical protein